MISIGPFLVTEFKNIQQLIFESIGTSLVENVKVHCFYVLDGLINNGCRITLAGSFNENANC